MKVTYSGHNLNITDDIHAYILKRADKIEARFKEIQELAVVLRAEKNRFDAEILVKAPRVPFHASSETHEILAAIDTATDKILTQVRRYQDRLKDRRQEVPHREVVAQLNPEEEATATDVDDSEAPVVLPKQDQFAPKPLTLAEATTDLQASDAAFLLFLNAETRQVNLLYKMSKGTYGWVEPLFS